MEGNTVYDPDPAFRHSSLILDFVSSIVRISSLEEGNRRIVSA